MLFKNKQKSKDKTSPVSIVDSNSIISEQFKMVRTNIEFSSIDEEIKTIVITSINPNAGKSTVSSNLAKSFATQEKKVLLVDADLRRPTIHKVFDVNNTIGLSTMFSQKDLPITETIQQSYIDNLSILPSGVIPPNPSEMLSSKKMRGIIHELEQYYDIVIFDMPPFTAVADAQIMSSKTDGTVFVLRRGVDSKDHIKKCKELVSSSNANVIGAVFNLEEDKGVHYYYYN